MRTSPFSPRCRPFNIGTPWTPFFFEWRPNKLTLPPFQIGTLCMSLNLGHYISISENARAMLNKIREYKKQLPANIWRLRDEQAKFERDLSQMLLILKRALPANRKGIHNLGEYHTYLQALRTKPVVDLSPFERYNGILETVKGNIEEITKSVYYRLCQVHVAMESEHQRKHKKAIRQIAVETVAMVSEDYDLSVVRHPEWSSRLLPKEEPFLGFVCLVPVVIDAIVDIDENLDEYMAGFPATSSTKT